MERAWGRAGGRMELPKTVRAVEPERRSKSRRRSLVLAKKRKWWGCVEVLPFDSIDEEEGSEEESSATNNKGIRESWMDGWRY